MPAALVAELGRGCQSAAQNSPAGQSPARLPSLCLPPPLLLQGWAQGLAALPLSRPWSRETPFTRHLYLSVLPPWLQRPVPATLPGASAGG